MWEQQNGKLKTLTSPASLREHARLDTLITHEYTEVSTISLKDWQWFWRPQEVLFTESIDDKEEWIKSVWLLGSKMLCKTPPNIFPSTTLPDQSTFCQTPTETRQSNQNTNQPSIIHTTKWRKTIYHPTASSVLVLSPLWSDTISNGAPSSKDDNFSTFAIKIWKRKPASLTSFKCLHLLKTLQPTSSDLNSVTSHSCVCKNSVNSSLRTIKTVTLETEPTWCHNVDREGNSPNHETLEKHINQTRTTNTTTPRTFTL